jgi:hypothetical protein
MADDQDSDRLLGIVDLVREAVFADTNPPIIATPRST